MLLLPPSHSARASAAESGPPIAHDLADKVRRVPLLPSSRSVPPTFSWLGPTLAHPEAHPRRDWNPQPSDASVDLDQASDWSGGSVSTPRTAVCAPCASVVVRGWLSDLAPGMAPSLVILTLRSIGRPFVSPWPCAYEGTRRVRDWLAASRRRCCHGCQRDGRGVVLDRILDLNH
jgi:hypothetical protein